MTSDDDEPSGDPACWLNLVCDVCGALPEGEADSCWRCGSPLPRRT